MEQNQPNPGTSLFQLNLDAGNSYTLKSAASWAKVLAITGIIIGVLFFGIGLLVQNAISNNYGGDRYGNTGLGGSNKMLANAGMVTYIVMGLILLISSIFALNFGNKISRALKANDQAALSGGFAAVRNYFAFWAILMIICVLLMLIGVAGMMSAR
jgi:hypothetical protein